MKLKQFVKDEDAVSPVIGVILMVAITVILAAVIGTFVLGLGENVQDSAPQANFQFEYPSDTYEGSSTFDDDTIDITHTGGEDVDESTLSVTVKDITMKDLTTGGDGDVDTGVSSGFGSETVSTGSTVTLVDNRDFDGSGAVNADGSEQFVGGDTVRVVWTSPSGGTSNTIGQSTVPS